MFGEFLRDPFHNFWDGSRRDVGQIKCVPARLHLFSVLFLQEV